jgi:transcription elongation factor Elf1
MRAIVTCECCGHRQTVARAIEQPGTFHLVCHECERSLRVDVSPEDLSAAARTPRSPSADRATAA